MWNGYQSINESINQSSIDRSINGTLVTRHVLVWNQRIAGAETHETRESWTIIIITFSSRLEPMHTKNTQIYKYRKTKIKYSANA